MAKQLPNEADVVAENKKLKADLEAAITLADENALALKECNTKLENATASIATLQATNASQAENITALQASVAKLTTERDTLATANKELSEKEQDLTKRTAAEVAKLGIATTPVPAPTAQQLQGIGGGQKPKEAKEPTGLERVAAFLAKRLQ